MKIDFENEFDNYTLSKGYDYFLSNKVTNVASNKDNFITATVTGTNNYNVSLEIDDDVLVDGDCTCPYFEGHGYCKHITATLYYLNNKVGNDKDLSHDSLKELVNKVDETELRNFIYMILRNNADVLNKFRIEFDNYFPKLSKKDYKHKIDEAIYSCSDRHGFIDYNLSYRYEHAMFEFTNEASKLVDEGDYLTAFNIVTALLDSIPATPIDDSNGSTGSVAESAIEIIHDILDKEDNNISKDILDYVLNELRTGDLEDYSIDLTYVLKYFVDNDMYLDDICLSLQKKLNDSKDSEYFYHRSEYIEYLIHIYNYKNEPQLIMKLLKTFSFDSKVCMKYVDELLKNNNVEEAIKVLKTNINNTKYRKDEYASRLAEIYLNNNMKNEYKDILYSYFYEYSKYDIDIYLKIKDLYSQDEWNIEKLKIIEDVKKDNYYNTNALNKIYIAEEMYDDLFKNVCNNSIDSLIRYEEYLLPKYNQELQQIYATKILGLSQTSGNRNKYREIASYINHLIKMDNSEAIAKKLLKEINERYLVDRSAMRDEFQKNISKLEYYI